MIDARRRDRKGKRRTTAGIGGGWGLEGRADTTEYSPSAPLSPAHTQEKRRKRLEETMTRLSFVCLLAWVLCSCFAFASSCPPWAARSRFSTSKIAQINGLARHSQSFIHAQPLRSIDWGSPRRPTDHDPQGRRQPHLTNKSLCLGKTPSEGIGPAKPMNGGWSSLTLHPNRISGMSEDSISMARLFSFCLRSFGGQGRDLVDSSSRFSPVEPKLRPWGRHILRSSVRNHA